MVNYSFHLQLTKIDQLVKELDSSTEIEKCRDIAYNLMDAIFKGLIFYYF